MELEAIKEASATIRALNEKNGLDLNIVFDPQVGVLVLEERKSGDEIIRLHGGTTVILFNKLIENFPILMTRHGWEK
jgi:hypothetical protein